MARARHDAYEREHGRVPVSYTFRVADADADGSDDISYGGEREPRVAAHANRGPARTRCRAGV